MSIKKSLYEVLTIESNDQKRKIDLITGAILFEYYEDIFSPVITAKVKIVNTGNVIVPPNDKSGSKQSIYNGLPLRGGERVSLKISGNSATNPALDFSKRVTDYFYVSGITDVISETQRESFTLHLTSREAITNETIRVTRKYPNSLRISDSVSKILKDVLKTNKIKSGNIETTSNKYGFIGNMRKPFTVLIWLASKSVPEKSKDSSAGFLFFQTQDGFQFKSIDGLIEQPVRKDIKGNPIIYTYSEAIVSYDGADSKVNNDYKILNYIIDRNQNLVEKLKLGTYASQRMFFNPLNFKFTSDKKGLFNSKNYQQNSSNLGSKQKFPKITSNSDITLGDVPTRIITQILDIGTMDPNVSTKENMNPEKYQSQSITRYNTLFTQTLSVMVPVNTNLRAGDIIECRFPKISQSDAKEYDTETSGLYMIKELCHHFDVESSYTSMKLIRDTFGIKK